MKPERKHIYLIGFSGSGKSSVAKQLGAKLRCRSADMDAMIEKRFGMSIPEIFERYGERAFRDAETTILKIISRSRTRSVVATGGGCIEKSVNRRMMQKSGIVICLQCSMRELARRLHNSNDRPMLTRGESPISTMKILLSRRKPLYTQADMKISTSNLTIGEVTSRVVAQLRKCGYAD